MGVIVMHTFRGPVSEAHPHIEALLAKHAMLSERIEEARKHPSMDDMTLQQLKSQRLRLKDEIAEYRQRTG